MVWGLGFTVEGLVFRCVFMCETRMGAAISRGIARCAAVLRMVSS